MYNFICVHLVHGQKNAAKRNDMMSDLVKNLKIFRDEIDPDVLSDFSFILGDLNYRLESTFTDLEPYLPDKIKDMREKLD